MHKTGSFKDIWTKWPCNRQVSRYSVNIETRCLKFHLFRLCNIRESALIGTFLWLNGLCYLHCRQMFALVDATGECLRRKWWTCKKRRRLRRVQVGMRRQCQLYGSWLESGWYTWSTLLDERALVWCKQDQDWCRPLRPRKELSRSVIILQNLTNHICCPPNTP